ncbi:unnamed protein product [Caenorhabditis nigoni]
MSTQPLDVATMMTRALASFRLQGADLRYPSLSLDSFSAVARNVLVMDFPAIDFFFRERDEFEGFGLMRAGLMVSRAAWEMTLDEPVQHAVHCEMTYNIFHLPNRQEGVTIVAHTFPAPPPALQQLEYSATVARGGVDVTIMEGSSLIRVLPPPTPGAISPRVVNGPAPHHPRLVIPIHVAPVPDHVPAAPAQQPGGHSGAAPRPSKTQLRRERRERVLLQIAREQEERDREERGQAMLGAPGPSGVQHNDPFA